MDMDEFKKGIERMIKENKNTVKLDDLDPWDDPISE